MGGEACQPHGNAAPPGCQDCEWYLWGGGEGGNLLCGVTWGVNLGCYVG